MFAGIMMFLHFERIGRLIRRADEAQRRRDWPKAIRLYETIVRRKPALAHIWEQLGHALKESGSLEAALSAYRQAVALDGEMMPVRAEMEHLKLRIWRERNGGDPDASGRFRFVNLGTTGTCNASCIHCPTGKATTAHVPRGTMPMPLFERIIDGIAESDFPVTDQIAFGLFGDALVDPLVVQRAEYLRSRLPTTRLSINTNGAAFNRLRHAPLKDLATLVMLHCESILPETYNDLMRPLRAERVFPKIEQLLEAFDGKVSVSVPLSKRNLNEADAIRDWFMNRGASEVVFDPLSSRCAEDLTLFNSLALNPAKIACGPQIMDDLIIDTDGKVLMCCQDFQRIEGIGAMGEDGVETMFADPLRAITRRRLSGHRHDEITTCNRCYADNRGDATVPLLRTDSANIREDA